MEEKMPDLAGNRIGDVLPQLAELGNAVLVHERNGTESAVIAPEDLLKLTDVGREIYSDLMNAQVKEIRSTSDVMEVVISGVEPEAMERFCSDFAAFEEAERLMGPSL